MSDYISREAAEILMCYACGFACKHYKRVSGQSLITADDCYHLYNITNIPAADVAEVRHGYWWDRGSLSCRCSCCGCKNDRETRYCPHCGATMDESEDKE